MNTENLVPNNRRSPNEVRENGRKGGIASGKSRRKKADLRELAQTIIDGTYTDENGSDISCEELIVRGIIQNLRDPSGKSFLKTVELLVRLTGADQSPEQKAKISAEKELIDAKTRDYW